MDPARRTIFTADPRLIVAAGEQGKPVTLSGYALVYNELSTDRGGFKARLLPGSASFTASSTRCTTTTTATCWRQNGRHAPHLPDAVGVRVEFDLPEARARESAGKTPRDYAIIV